MHYTLGQLQSNTQAAAETALRHASTTAVVVDFVSTLVKEVEAQSLGRQQATKLTEDLQVLTLCS